MPEAYAHVKYSKIAHNLSKSVNYNLKAFKAGAQGPDVFFCYRIWTKNRKVDLPKMANTLHNYRSGDFLLSMIKNAKTNAQKGYVQGFLCHYALDTNVHPYIEFVSSKGQSYDMPKGHGFYEIALDTKLFLEDYGYRTKPHKITNANLQTNDLADISRLLKNAFDNIDIKDIPIDAISDTFHHFDFLHSLFYSRFGGKKIIFKIIENVFMRKKGFINCHVVITKMKPNLPETWNHLVNNKEYTGGVEPLLKQGTMDAVKYLIAVEKYWNNNISLEEIKEIIGNKNYVTGLEM